MIRPITSQNSAKQGFVLLEVVLALGLFGMVAVSMTAAINEIAVASRSSRQEGQVLRAMESALAEVAHQPELKPGTRSFSVNSEGVVAAAFIEKAELETKTKTRLDHMFRVVVDAWIADGERKVMKRHIETIVYAPNSPSA